MTNVSYKNISKKKRRYFSDLYTTLLDSSWSYCVVMFTTSFYGSWIIFGQFNQNFKSETAIVIVSNANNADSRCNLLHDLAPSWGHQCWSTKERNKNTLHWPCYRFSKCWFNVTYFEEWDKKLWSFTVLIVSLVSHILPASLFSLIIWMVVVMMTMMVFKETRIMKKYFHRFCFLFHFRTFTFTDFASCFLFSLETQHTIG